MLDLWQNLPLSFHSVLISFGPIYITWYAIAYLLGTVFAGAYFLLLSFRKQLFPTFGESIDLLVSILWGVLIGARLGYVFFYGGDEFFREPWRIVSPYDFSLGQWIGIRGMSFHGGLIGAGIGLLVYIREAKHRFFEFSDVLVQATPIAILFGRIGNFLNQEIPGRITMGILGMHFPYAPSVLRFPITLCEGLFEGLFLFFILRFASERVDRPGMLTALFFILYALSRFLLEGYRETVPFLVAGNLFTMGQGLSLVMLVVGGVFLGFSRRRVV